MFMASTMDLGKKSWEAVNIYHNPHVAEATKGTARKVYIKITQMKLVAIRKSIGYHLPSVKQ